MEIYALVGRRGTGKSHHAPLLAYQYQIDYILDDGLLIKGNQVLAGRSAKRENTRYGAIKRALLQDKDHARQLREKLAELEPPRLLILATSERMAQAIAERLGLPHPHHYIHIEEIASPEEINKARRLRQEENRHVIPLPTFAIKKDFPGYLIDPLRSFFSLPSGEPRDVAVERSIIRPVYSNLGNFYIAEHVVTELVSHIMGQVPGIHRAGRVEIKSQGGKMILNVDVVLSLEQMPPGKNMRQILKEAQQRLKEELEYLTGFYLDEINVTARRIHLNLDERKE
ncbi:MAG: Asp23/Gls24 family envelope stress response protein [Firmicutes bacterium]|jgi:uncharacterized alkaline shock family protein YloU|nr:Asp23/Gls24 family envelope stress response protein [Bacillota bacterium]HPU00857.1 hypothetical protein [Bacillota bacterium]